MTGSTTSASVTLDTLLIAVIQYKLYTDDVCDKQSNSALIFPKGHFETSASLAFDTYHLHAGPSCQFSRLSKKQKKCNATLPQAIL
jgi:hypothetical protein